MAMTNMEWIRVARAGGRDPNVRLAADADRQVGAAPAPQQQDAPGTPATSSSKTPENAAPQQQQNPVKSAPQETVSSNEVKRTLAFRFDQWSYLFEEAVLRFQIKGGTGFHSDTLKLAEGELDVAGVLIPKNGGSLKVSVDLEDKQVSGQCAIAPGEDDIIYVKVEARYHEGIKTEQQTSGVSRQGNQVTVGAKASASGKVGIPLVAEGAVSVEGSVQDQLPRHDQNSSTTSTFQQPVPIVTGVTLTVTKSEPTITSSLENGTPRVG